MLSTFQEMKLWNWEKNWSCEQTFKTEHSDSIRQVAFSTKDTNTFASASSDHTIKVQFSLSFFTSIIKATLTEYELQFILLIDIDCEFETVPDFQVWSLSSPTSLYTLYGHSDRVNCLDFFTFDEQQYLISGSQDCSAKV